MPSITKLAAKIASLLEYKFFIPRSEKNMNTTANFSLFFFFFLLSKHSQAWLYWAYLPMTKGRQGLLLMGFPFSVKQCAVCSSHCFSILGSSGRWMGWHDFQSHGVLWGEGGGRFYFFIISIYSFIYFPGGRIYEIWLIAFEISDLQFYKRFFILIARSLCTLSGEITNKMNKVE